MSSTLPNGIRTRAKRLRLVSWVSLVLVLAVLCAGTWFFVYASDLSLKDATKQAEFRLSQMKELSEREDQVQRKYDMVREELRREIAGESGTGIHGYGPSARQHEYQVFSNEEELSRIRKSLAALSNEQAQDVKVPTVVSPQFINTILTRVLVVVLLAFFVQLLAGQYRYTLRMASHLDSIADAVELQAGGIPHQDLAEILKATTPTRIDFTGKSEVQLSMLQDFLKLLRSK